MITDSFIDTSLTNFIPGDGTYDFFVASNQYLLSHYLPKHNLNVLDIGCGTLRNFITLQTLTKDFEYHGIDKNSLILERASAFYQKDFANIFTVHDVEKPFPSSIMEKRYDVIFLDNILHLLKLPAFYNCMYAVQLACKPRSHIRVIVPLGQQSIVERKIQGEELYIQFFTQEKIVSFLSSFGFKPHFFQKFSDNFGQEFMVCLAQKN